MLLNPDRYWWLMPTSMAVAMFWLFWPISQTFRQFAPDSVVMVMLYWSMRRPQNVSSGWAFIIGLIVDSIDGSPLGMHALAMVVVVYIVQLLAERLRIFAIWQQSLVVAGLYVIYLLVCDWIWLLPHLSTDKPIPFMTAISTGLCWPACYLLLNWLEQGTSRRSVRP